MKKLISPFVLLFAAVVLLFLTRGSAQAVGGSYAFGYKAISALKGNRVYLWTGTPPGNQIWTASPVGMCKYSSCSGRKIETGWIRGTAGELNDQLQQYVGYTDLDGDWEQVFNLGYLNTNTWYQMKIMYSRSADRWEAWRFNQVVWPAPSTLGWKIGEKVSNGSEANNVGGWMDTYGWHPEYKLWTGGDWTLYNYVTSQTSGGGNITHVYDYGYRAWGNID